MIVHLVVAPMSMSEYILEVPALPRAGDHIQLWTNDSKLKDRGGNFEVTSVMFAGECKARYKKTVTGIMVHVKQV